MIAFCHALCYQYECIQILRHYLTKFVHVHFWSFRFFHIICTTKISRLPAAAARIIQLLYNNLFYMYFIRFINTPRSDPRILVRGGLFRINISILQHALTRISSYSPIYSHDPTAYLSCRRKKQPPDVPSSRAYVDGKVPDWHMRRNVIKSIRKQLPLPLRLA